MKVESLKRIVMSRFPDGCASASGCGVDDRPLLNIFSIDIVTEKAARKEKTAPHSSLWVKIQVKPEFSSF
jgi:hypothetical protein